MIKSSASEKEEIIFLMDLEDLLVFMSRVSNYQTT